jgi:predicted flap endonuclease-1-like 5' DNA nuclease
MLLVAFIIGYLICRCKSRCGGKSATAAVATGVATAGVVAATSVKSHGKDDLKLIEGVGPAIEKVLHAEGITTFAQVVDLEVSRIREILDAAGPQFKIRSGETWAEQAELGRDGKFEELAQLREELDNGKRV